MSKIVKHTIIILSILMVAVLSPGCYCNAVVQESEIGLEKENGASVSAVVGPGRYSSRGFFSTLDIIDVGAITVEWSDPNLATKDKQQIGLSTVMTIARTNDALDLQAMYKHYPREVVSDEALVTLALSRMPRAAKAVTTAFTLDEMLGVSDNDIDRETTTKVLFDTLQPELAEAYIILIDVGISNIEPSEGYKTKLEEKAAAQVATEVSIETTKQLIEQLKQEEQQTKIDVELARRENLVNEELAKVYNLSPEYYELEKLRLLQGVLGPRDKIYFVPQGSDLTLILGGSSGSVTPIGQP